MCVVVGWWRQVGVVDYVHVCVCAWVCARAWAGGGGSAAEGLVEEVAADGRVSCGHGGVWGCEEKRLSRLFGRVGGDLRSGAEVGGIL